MYTVEVIPQIPIFWRSSQRLEGTEMWKRACVAHYHFAPPSSPTAQERMQSVGMKAITVCAASYLLGMRDVKREGAWDFLLWMHGF